MEVITAKILAIFGTFILPLFCTLLPIKVHAVFSRAKRGKTILSWLMCFGGGVFLATFMLHMGPEVRRILDAALLEPHEISYPLADLIMGAGFFLVLFIEKIATRAQHKHAKMAATKRELNGDVTIPAKNGASINDDHHEDASVQLRQTSSDFAEDAVVTEFHTGHSHEEGFNHDTRSVVLALALSLHRIFEGMSVGLKHTSLGVANLFLAVMCHETVIGFSLGLSFALSEATTKRKVISAFLCSVIMPVGVALGTVIMEAGRESTSIDTVNGVLQAISTGTFLYVTFFEILHGEITHSDTSIAKVLWLLLGFLVMAALCAVPEPPEILDDVTTIVENVTTIAPYAN